MDKDKIRAHYEAEAQKAKAAGADMAIRSAYDSLGVAMRGLRADQESGIISNDERERRGLELRLEWRATVAKIINQ